MSRKTLELYAERARTIADPSLASGRLIATKGAEGRILTDVITKLDVGPGDTLLDIGSGIGTLTIPLSFVAARVTAVDHADVLERLRARAPHERIEYLTGNFLDVDFAGRRFSRILAYDVVHYLTDEAELFAFVDKAIQLLEPNGKLLLGDVPNDGLMERILATGEGQRYVAHWTKAKWMTSEAHRAVEEGLAKDPELVPLTEAMLFRIVAHARVHGHHAYFLRQDAGLPLWHQREDILIERLVPAPKRDLLLVKLGDGAAAVLGTRLAQPDDSEMYYAWSQDPTVRAASLRSEEFTFEQHQEWFTRKVNDPYTRMYVLERDAHMPLGQVRYEAIRADRPLWSGGPLAEVTPGTAEVSISIDPRARGVGLATFLLTVTHEQARKELDVERIRALVKVGNDASVGSFVRAGYKAIGEIERLGQQVTVLEK